MENCGSVVILPDPAFPVIPHPHPAPDHAPDPSFKSRQCKKISAFYFLKIYLHRSKIKSHKEDTKQ
jgi:hypothetical protein